MPLSFLASFVNILICIFCGVFVELSDLTCCICMQHINLIHSFMLVLHSTSTSDALVNSVAATCISNFKHQSGAKSGDALSSVRIRRGSSGLVGSMMLLESRQQMHAPLTQVDPLWLGYPLLFPFTPN